MKASLEPTISPLAQRLAEENNVAWRELKGSSAGGAVNERDILDYLEAVMLGNRPLDPTPEPLPEGLGAWPEEARRQAPAEAPVTPPPAAPVRTFEAEYRAALAEVETLNAKVARLEADIARGQTEGLELRRLRDTVTGQEEALTKARAFEPQVAGLKEALASAQLDLRKAQEHGFELAARLNKLNDDQGKAEAETKRLREANAALEQTLTTLQTRPWWKFWG